MIMMPGNLNSLKILWKQTTWHSQDTILKHTEAQLRLGEQNTHLSISGKLYIKGRFQPRLEF